MIFKRKKYWAITYATPKNQTLTTTIVMGDFTEVVRGVTALDANLMFARRISKKEAKKHISHAT